MTKSYTSHQGFHWGECLLNNFGDFTQKFLIQQWRVLLVWVVELPPLTPTCTWGHWFICPAAGFLKWETFRIHMADVSGGMEMDIHGWVGIDTEIDTGHNSKKSGWRALVDSSSIWDIFLGKLGDAARCPQRIPEVDCGSQQFVEGDGSVPQTPCRWRYAEISPYSSGVVSQGSC